MIKRQKMFVPSIFKQTGLNFISLTAASEKRIKYILSYQNEIPYTFFCSL